MIILIGSNKGGTGKTTTAINLASYFGSKLDVLLCDSDNQQSLVQWNALREEGSLKPFDFVCLYGEIASDLIKYSEKYDLIIVDVAGRNSKEFLSVLSICDIFISPVQCTQLDLNTLLHLNEQIEVFKGYNEKLIDRAYILHNRATTNIFIQNTERKNIEEFIDELPNLKLLKTSISERKIFKDCISEGKGIFDYSEDEKPAKALAEYQSLINELTEEELSNEIA